MSLNPAQSAGLPETEVQLRQLLQREQLFSEITQRIRRSLKLEDVLNTAVEEVRQLLQTDRVLLYQFTSPDWGGEIAVESVGENCLSIIGMAIQDDCFRQDHAFLYRQGRVRAIADIHTADIAPCHRDLLFSLQVRANLVVPVMHNEELWGLLIAHHCQSAREWQSWEIELLEQLSTVIAIAIQRASLFNQLQTQLAERDAIAEIAQRIRGSLNLEDVLNTAVTEVWQLLQTDRVMLLQFSTPDWLGKVVVESVGDPAFSVLGREIQDDCFRQNHAAKYRAGHISSIEDISTSKISPCHREMLSNLQVRANLVVPVLHNEELWGLLIAQHCQSAREWQISEIELLKQLSTVIAIAIQQASLFNQLQTQLAEREAISQALQISRERLRTVVSNAPIALIATNAEGIITLSSGIILHQLGRSTEDLIGSSAFDVYAHIPGLVEELQRALTGESFTSSVEYQGYIFEVRYSPKVDANGTSQGVICVATDVTEQRRAEEALRQSEILRQSEAKNRALLNAIPDAILRIQQDGTCLDFKPSKAEDFLLPATIVGRQLADVLPVEVARQFMVYLRRALETHKPQVFDYQLQNGKSIDYEARIVVNGADEVLAIVRDISERKKVEQLKNEFVSTVSHELRTPLTSIRGSLGLLMGGVAGELATEAQELVSIAYKNSERLILLINDILDIEKIESGKMSFALKPVELVPLVEQAIAANRAYAEQFNVTLTLTQALPNVQVNVDSQRFIQVLTNLLSNAAKFSPPAETVSVSITQHAEMVRVSVQDRGVGIPEEFRDRIFQKFAQADSSDARQKGGTGLGLSIAKAIVERLNGRIGFETELNVGTTFYCELPVWTWPQCELTVPASAHQPRQPTKPLRYPSARILVCEDDPDIALLLSMMLQHAGFWVDVAHDAEVAKELLVDHLYQVMTLDLALPGQDGISLIRELRLQKQTRLLPIIVVSAKAKQGQEALGGVAVVDWLEKPIEQQRLIALCQQAISQNRNAKPKILHIEDNADVTQIVSMVLKQEAEIYHATNLQQARQQLEASTFDLIVLDVSLPDGSGLELLPFVNRQTGLPIPVVLFSAREVNPETAHRVTTALVKSRTTNQELLSTIQALVAYCE